MYGKIFTQIYDGSLYGRWQALVTFQQFIVLADKDGTVDMTAGAIAARTSIPLDIIQQGIRELEEADPASRTPDEEGRRIVRLSDHRDWGWEITNYKYYRAIRTAEERREYFKEHKRASRKAKRASQELTESTAVHHESTDSTNSSKQYAVSSKQDDVTMKVPNADDSLEIGLIRQYGDKWDSVRLFLDQRDLRTRPAWVKEIATLTVAHGPDVVAQSCNDAAAAEDPVKVPAGLRAFAARNREARKRPSNGDTPANPQAAALRAVAAIRALISTTQQPGQAQVRFIPIESVKALGAPIAQAYADVGGADRFLTTDGKDVQWLVRDFALALTA